MKHLSTWFASILITSALLLSAARTASALEHKRNDRDHQQQTSEQNEKSSNAQPTLLVPSPAYYAAILGELGALISEEVTKAEQERADHESWNPPTVWQFVVSVVLAGIGALYTFFAWRQWIAIRRQGDIAQDTLTQTSRPWIYPEISIGSGLTYDVNGANITFQVILKNTGHSVAKDVWPDLKLLLRIPKIKGGLIGEVAEQRKL